MSYLWLVLKPCVAKNLFFHVYYQIWSSLSSTFRINAAQQRQYNFDRSSYILKSWFVSIACVFFLFSVPLLILSTQTSLESYSRDWDGFSPAGCPFASIIDKIAFLSLAHFMSPFLLFRTLWIVMHLCFLFFLQFHRRIYKGIPLQFRGQVWSLLLDVPKMKEEMKDLYSVSC